MTHSAIASAPDCFYDYLDYCETHELTGVGDYVEKFHKGKELVWTRLTIDILDTFRAGLLERHRLPNGSAAYTRKKGMK